MLEDRYHFVSSQEDLIHFTYLYPTIFKVIDLLKTTCITLDLCSLASKLLKTKKSFWGGLVEKLAANAAPNGVELPALRPRTIPTPAPLTNAIIDINSIGKNTQLVPCT